MSTMETTEMTVKTADMPPIERLEPIHTIGLQRVFALLRLAMGWTFLWAFLDKAFALGFSTGRVVNDVMEAENTERSSDTDAARVDVCAGRAFQYFAQRGRVIAIALLMQRGNKLGEGGLHGEARCFRGGAPIAVALIDGHFFAR